MNKTVNNRINKSFYIAAFFIMNIINGFLSSSSLFNKGLSPYDRSFFMVVNSLFGDLGFFVIALGLAILLFRSDKSRFSFLVWVTAFASFLIFLLSMYFSNFGMFFSFYNVRTLAQAGAGNAMGFVGDALIMLLRGAQFLFWIPTIVMILLNAIFFSKKQWSKGVYTKAFVKGLHRLYFGIATVVVGLLLMANTMTAFLQEIQETWYEDNATPLYGVQAVGFFNYYVYDVYAYATNKMNQIDEEKYTATLEKLETYKEECNMLGLDGVYYCNSSEHHGILSGKNLLMVQAESINNFLIGLEVNIDGEWVEITPNMNKMLAQSVYFQNFYTSVGIGNTSDAEFSAITGLYPTGPAYTVFEYATDRYPSLARAFNRADYTTFSVHANTGIFYDRKTIHENMYEFNKHYSSEDLDLMGVNDPDRFIHRWLNDVDLLKTTVTIMKQENDKGNAVFAFPLTVTSHMPYLDHPNFYQDHTPIFPSDFQMFNAFHLGYLKHAHYLDYSIGVMLDELEKQGILDNTVVIVYGDHGSGLDMETMFLLYPQMFRNDINGVFGVDYATQSSEHKLASRQMQLEIPFIIYDSSGVLTPSVETQVGSIVDIPRTLRNVFGLDSMYYFGRDLFADVPHYIYNPKNGDIYINGFMVSSNSKETYVFGEVDFGEEGMQVWIDRLILAFREYKDFNDKLLKYQSFEPQT
jgi:lipoteichoic acid synthase